MNASGMVQSLIAHVTAYAANAGSPVQGGTPRVPSDLGANGLMESASIRFEAVLIDAGMNVAGRTEQPTPQIQPSAQSASVSVQGHESEQTPRGHGYEREANAKIPRGEEQSGQYGISETARDDSSRSLPVSKARLDARETAPESMADHLRVYVHMPEGSHATMAPTVTEGSNQELATLEQPVDDCGAARQTWSVQSTVATALFTERSNSWSTTVPSVPEAMFSNPPSPASIATTSGLGSPVLSTEAPGEQPRVAVVHGALTPGTGEWSERPVGAHPFQPVRTDVDRLAYPLSDSTAYSAITHPVSGLTDVQSMPSEPSLAPGQALKPMAGWLSVESDASMDALSDLLASSGTVPVLEASAGEAAAVVPVPMYPTSETISLRGEGLKQAEPAASASTELSGADQHTDAAGAGATGRVESVEPKGARGVLGTQLTQAVEPKHEPVGPDDEAQEPVAVRENDAHSLRRQASPVGKSVDPSQEVARVPGEATPAKSAHTHQDQTELHQTERTVAQPVSEIPQTRLAAGPVKSTLASAEGLAGPTRYAEQVHQETVVEAENSVRPQQKAAHPGDSNAGSAQTEASHAGRTADSVGKAVGPVKSTAEPAQSSYRPAESPAVGQERSTPDEQGKAVASAEISSMRSQQPDLPSTHETNSARLRNAGPDHESMRSESTAGDPHKGDRAMPSQHENARTRQVHDAYEVLNRSRSSDVSRTKMALSESVDASASRSRVALFSQATAAPLAHVESPSQGELGRARPIDDGVAGGQTLSDEHTGRVEQRDMPARLESTETKLERTRVDVGSRRVMTESRGSEPIRTVDPQGTPGQASAVEQRAHLGAERSHSAVESGEQAKPRSVVNQIVNRVSIEASRTKPTITVSLKPERLGSVEVRVEVDNGRILASIQAETDEARRILRSSTSQLVSALKEQGLQVSEVRIGSVQASQPDIGRDELRQQFAQGQQFSGGDSSLQMDSHGDFGQQGHGRFQQPGTYAMWDGYLQGTPEGFEDSGGAMVRSMRLSGQLEYRA